MNARESVVEMMRVRLIEARDEAGTIPVKHPTLDVMVSLREVGRRI